MNAIIDQQRQDTERRPSHSEVPGRRLCDGSFVQHINATPKLLRIALEAVELANRLRAPMVNRSLIPAPYP